MIVQHIWKAYFAGWCLGTLADLVFFFFLFFNMDLLMLTMIDGTDLEDIVVDFG